MSWVSPTGYEDPDGDWDNEPNAFDKNVGTQAAVDHTLVYREYSGFLYLTLPSAITSSKIRYYKSGSVTGRKIDIDVYVNGVWVNVYYGNLESGWIEHEFTEGSVTQARIRGQGYYSGARVGFSFNEFEFWMHPPPAEYVVTIDSEPVKGVPVTIDGVTIGGTPLSRNVQPGVRVIGVPTEVKV